jgi:low affinity Fe/Cu permease
MKYIFADFFILHSDINLCSFYVCCIMMIICAVLCILRYDIYLCSFLYTALCIVQFMCTVLTQVIMNSNSLCILYQSNGFFHDYIQVNDNKLLNVYFIL